MEYERFHPRVWKELVVIMAERRMFTKKVTDDDNFVNLSSSAQALYLHLSMSADDDGFCNKISTCMFKAHASVSDLESLLKARYVYQFENGVIVIKHWRMANALRKDRYTPTAFQEEFKQLKIKDNGSYTRLPDGCQMVADCLPQSSVGKDNISSIPTLEEVREYVAYWKLTVDPVKFFSHYESANWTDSTGKPINNWRWLLHACERGEKNKPVHGDSDEDDSRFADIQLYDYISS